MGALKLTTQQFYRVTGDSTQNRGVTADVSLPWLWSQTAEVEADLDYAIPFHKIDSMSVEKYSALDAELLKKLTLLSAKRRDNSDDFQEFRHDLALFLERKDRTEVTLNEVKFFAERDAFSTADRKPKAVTEVKDEGPIVKDYYMLEALAITCDYVRFGPWDSVDIK